MDRSLENDLRSFMRIFNPICSYEEVPSRNVLDHRRATRAQHDSSDVWGKKNNAEMTSFFVDELVNVNSLSTRLLIWVT